MNALAPRQDLTIDIRTIGQSREPLLVIDDFLEQPEALIAGAAASPDWRDLPPGGYPGRRAPLPGSYVRSVLRRLDAPIRERLFERAMQLDRFECSFSLVTHAPAELAKLQRVPHIDIARDSRVAILHYLCGPGFGGTAFFRQDATGLEQVSAEDRARYLEARTKGLEDLGPDHGFPDDETPGYTRTDKVGIRYNRLVVYRSFNLHSGIIDHPEQLSTDPEKGRLTANFFVDYRPVESGDSPTRS